MNLTSISVQHVIVSKWAKVEEVVATLFEAQHKAPHHHDHGTEK
jgi:hypothetical protein